MTLKGKFFGSYEELSQSVSGIYGRWQDLPGSYRFRDADGGVLEWWPTTDTIVFQGDPKAAKRLQERVFPTKPDDGLPALKK